MSTSRCKSGSSSAAPAPNTIRRASVSPSTNAWNALVAATTSSAPATLNSMRVVYSYPASLRRRCTRFTTSRARPSCSRSSGDWLVQADGPYVVALDPQLTEDLVQEGLAREVLGQLRIEGDDVRAVGLDQPVARDLA